MWNELCTLNVACANPDCPKDGAAQMGRNKNLTDRKIHIAAIQETHIPYGQKYLINGYRIITLAAVKINHPEIPGISIVRVETSIRETLGRHITNIRRISSRTITVTLQSKLSHKPITIISTYAPHQGQRKHGQNNPG